LSPGLSVLLDMVSLCHA